MRLTMVVLALALLAVASARVGAQSAPASEDEAALATIDEIAKEVEEMRGLAFKEKFDRRLIASSEIPAMLERKMKEELPPEKLAKMNKLYSRMGFFAPTVDLVKAVSGLLEAGAAGFYDPEEKALYLVRGYSLSGARPIIFHELVHALEDQHFGLLENRAMIEEHGDRAAAMLAVTEGSAQSLMDRWLAAHPDVAKAFAADEMKKAASQTKMVVSLPVVITAAMALYPYKNGPTFVDAVTGKDPVKIAGLYAKPPASSEQILHPEKYATDPDPPQEVKLADLSGVLPEGWTTDFTDVVGELQIGLLLNEFLGGPPIMKLARVMNLATQALRFSGAAATGSAGWDGDRVVSCFSPDGGVGFVWASVWDTEKDATEFAEAYRAGLPYKGTELKLSPMTALVDQRGDKVMIVEGFPEAKLAGILAAAWAGTRFDVPFEPKPAEEPASPAEPEGPMDPAAPDTPR